ncbi:MAG: hypothetical protein AUJ98_09220 [Bacteroidetes bacterium CG2_30_33_31]|nr:MAG: hypothetical protein AUJ98_09220 [Bacteroidetes bacterium CG2_30_33_31]
MASQILKFKKMRIITFFLLFIFSLQIKGQDTLKVMSYNLLNYGNITSYCTATNNSLLAKEQDLRAIVKYVKPEILAVVELAANSYVHQRLLDSALNCDGVKYYKKANYSNISGSDLVSMLYYDSRILTFSKQYVLNSHVRDIVLYRLFYNDPNLSQTHDTAFINCIVGHLKSGSASSDEQDRATMTTNAMSWLNQNLIADNYLIMGDFNLKNSNEVAYQNLVNFSNASLLFFDPISRAGMWYNTASFSDIHTQSTHVSSTGCASIGGLDDRFDFILASNSVMNGINHFTYIPNSYYCLGNDGNHFNDAINSGTNNSAPQNIINSLYNLSDHLPVILKLKVNKQGASLGNILNTHNLNIKVVNPITNNLKFYISSSINSKLKIEVISIIGQLLFAENIYHASYEEIINLNFSSLESGLFFLKITDENGFSISHKILKL